MSNQHKSTKQGAISGEAPAGCKNAVATGKAITEYLKSKGNYYSTWGRRILPKRK
jgi:hypothetical protein